MDLLNKTGMLAGYTLGTEPSGRESLVVVVKGTFSLPKAVNGKPELLAEQQPLVMADTFTGEPGFSAPLLEADYAPIKPRCDVLLNGSAYAPNGVPTERVHVGFRLGALVKEFNVLGDRFWYDGTTGYTPSQPKRFTHMPISYDRAFGGMDNRHEDPQKHSAYMLNTAGRGYHACLEAELVEGQPLPNTEAIDETVTSPTGNYSPKAFGPLGRGWQPRLQYAGTYDQNWMDNVFPFLPTDFDNRYHQAAPEDQQIPYPVGGEVVVLHNLTADGKRQFTLPARDVPVVFFPRKGEKIEKQAVIDTILFEPDQERFSLVWRTQLPLKKDIFEITQMLAGKASRGWWRARELGKTYYPSLDHLVREKRREREENA